MNYEEYLKGNYWVDIEMFDLETLRFSEVSPSALKFMSIYNKLLGSGIYFLKIEKNRINFYTKELVKVSAPSGTKITKDYKIRMIKGNYFKQTEVDNLYIINDIRELVQGIMAQNKKTRCTPTFNGRKVGSIGQMNNQYLKKCESNKVLAHVDSKVFNCYFAYCKGTYNNEYYFEDADGLFFVSHKNKFYSTT